MATSSQTPKQQVLLTYLAVSVIPSWRDAALSPLQAEPRQPSALEGSITTGSDMAVGSHSVTATEGVERLVTWLQLGAHTTHTQLS